MKAPERFGSASLAICLGLHRPAVAAHAEEPEIKLTAQINLDYGSYDADSRSFTAITAGLTYCWIEHAGIMLNFIDVHSERRTRADNPNLLLTQVQLAL